MTVTSKKSNLRAMNPFFMVMSIIAILLMAGLITPVFAQNDDQQQQQTCPDGSQPDENGNCPSLHDQICNAYHSDAVQLLTILLPLAHIMTGGTTTAIMAAAALYCGG
jgi:hypothetical protein